MYVYFDGESHFIRSEQCVREVFGKDVTLEAVAERGARKYDELAQEHKDSPGPKSAGLYFLEGFKILVERRCKLFWDRNTFSFTASARRGGGAVTPSNMVYFSSCAGDEDLLHTLRVLVRDNGFEPQITKERAQLAKQRENMLGNEGIIEKAKGVDISLAVRLLEDAHRDVFDECILFTSDVDYVSAIQAVQRMGKKVYVFGYRNGIGKNSAMEFVPDGFVDLAICMAKRKEWLEHDYHVLSAEMQDAAQRLQEVGRSIQMHRMV